MLLVKILYLIIRIPCFFGFHKDGREWEHCDVSNWDYGYHVYDCCRCNKRVRKKINLEEYE